MSDQAYYKLAKTLDTLPNGFPPTESGVEIKLLKKVFEPDEAELFCKLKLTYETPEQIAQRSGLPLEGLGDKLESMLKKGQIESRDCSPSGSPQPAALKQEVSLALFLKRG